MWQSKYFTFSRLIRAAHPFMTKCRLCGNKFFSIKEIICDICFAKIIPFENNGCRICGSPAINDNSIICGSCKDKKIYFTKAVSAAYYDETAREIIHLFKYNSHPSLSKKLAPLLLQAVKNLPLPDIITYVPIHPKKLSQREFNQSYLLAYHLSKLMNKKMAGVLTRIKDTAMQSNLRKDERSENVKDAFRLNINSIKSLKDKTVLLIDDIYTTGNTINECAKEIKKAQPHKIYCATLAKTER